MKLSSSTKIHQLLKEHPALEEFLVQYDPKFDALRNKEMRATVDSLTRGTRSGYTDPALHGWAGAPKLIRQDP